MEVPSIFGTTVPLSKQHPVSGEGVNYSPVGERRTLNGDLCLVGRIEDEWLYLKYEANYEKRNMLFSFCFSIEL